MTKDEIQLALRHIAIGRVNTEAVMELAEKLSKLLTRDACDHCVMPGGEHFKFCPNHPNADAILIERQAALDAPKPATIESVVYHDGDAKPVDPDTEVLVSDVRPVIVSEPAKRGPGRPKKAD